MWISLTIISISKHLFELKKETAQILDHCTYSLLQVKLIKKRAPLWARRNRDD